jgi:hypothetical protein
MDPLAFSWKILVIFVVTVSMAWSQPLPALSDQLSECCCEAGAASSCSHVPASCECPVCLVTSNGPVLLAVIEAAAVPQISFSQARWVLSNESARRLEFKPPVPPPRFLA